MTVALVTNIPTPYRLHLYNSLAEALREHDQDLHVLYCAESEPDRDWTVDLNKARYDVTFLKPFPIVSSWAPKLHFNPNVLSTLASVSPDAVINGNYIRPTSRLVGRWCRHHNVPCAWWHESHAASSKNKSLLAVSARRLLFRRMDAVIVPGAPPLHQLRSHGWDGSHVVVPNLVDELVYEAEVDSLRTRGFGQLSSSWLFAGRFEPEKGVLELLDALQPSDPIRLRMAGTGSLLPVAEDLVQRKGLENVEILGFQDSDQMKRLFALSSVFVLPSLRDPSPLVLVEAAAAGLALLSSVRAGNCEDLVQLGVSGMSFDPTNPKSIRSAVSSATEWHPDELIRLGSGARRLFRENFSTDEVAPRLCNFILDLDATKCPITSPQEPKHVDRASAP